MNKIDTVRNVKYNFKPAYFNYESIKKVIDILETDGFVLQDIYTSGESSSHFFTVGFKSNYKSMKEFTENVFEKYEKHKELCGNSVSAEWDWTMFTLYNDSSQIEMTIISDGENAGKVFLSAHSKKFEELSEELLKKYDEYIIKKLGHMLEKN